MLQDSGDRIAGPTGEGETQQPREHRCSRASSGLEAVTLYQQTPVIVLTLSGGGDNNNSDTSEDIYHI